MRQAVAEMLGAKPDPKEQRPPASLGGPAQTEAPTKPSDDAVMAGELLPSLAYLQTELKKEIESGKMQINLQPRGLVVSLQQATFFPSGEDTLDPATYSSLEKVAVAMRRLPNPVRLEGHTDAIPIHTTRFRSNWELSAARAIAVLDLLTGRLEIPRERVAIAGYADTAPVAANDSEAGRARNRRVDIVILSRQQALTEPVSAVVHTTPPGPPPPAGVPHAPM
jgi:chemotaxis protein MotB